MILGPLFDLKFLNERAGNHCRNFKSAALARLWAASAQGVARLTRWRTIWGRTMEQDVGSRVFFARAQMRTAIDDRFRHYGRAISPTG